MPPSDSTPFTKGEEVEVFYRRSQDPYGYFPVDSPYHGLLRPRLGRTDGWILACVDEDWPRVAGAEAGDGCVHIRHTHLHWSNADGQVLNPEDDTDMLVSMPRRQVRRPDATRPPPALSLLIVRWGGEPGHFNEEQWGRASASISDTYINTFLDEACFGALGPDYEVLSAFVVCGTDLERLHPVAVQTGGSARSPPHRASAQGDRHGIPVPAVARGPRATRPHGRCGRRRLRRPRP